MLTCQVESLTRGFEEWKQWHVKHWEELALNKDKVPLSMQYGLYLQKDAAGEVLYVTAREDGRLLGYFVGFIAPALHYSTCLTLQMDGYWLHPELRNSDSLSIVDAEMICVELFETVKKEAKRRGVQRTFYGSKLHKDSAKLFDYLGMTEVERYYSEWIGD